VPTITIDYFGRKTASRKELTVFSLTEAARVSRVLMDTDLRRILVQMTEYSSSVDLNWGEDTEQWEASWVVGGQRYTAFSDEPETAIRQCVRKAITPPLSG
jgi:predicted Zn-dependent protease